MKSRTALILVGLAVALWAGCDESESTTPGPTGTTSGSGSGTAGTGGSGASTGGTAGTAGTGGAAGGNGGAGGGVTNHQFVFADQAFTWEDGNNGAVTQLGPTNWLSPIDYASGRIYLRYEVAVKPSDKLIAYQVCVWQDNWTRESCASCEGFTTTGVYYRDLGSPGTDWWVLPGGDIDYTREFQRVSVMHKETDCMGNLMSSTACGTHCYTGGDLNDHIPITGHVTMIVVPPGETLIPPGDWTGCPAGWGCD